MNRLAKLISELSREDLILVAKDLEAGNITRLIKQRLNQLEESKQCPICGSDLRPEDRKFVLEFGPPDLRQRAYFDEQDCLTYFLEKEWRTHNA